MWQPGCVFSCSALSSGEDVTVVVVSVLPQGAGDASGRCNARGSALVQRFVAVEQSNDKSLTKEGVYHKRREHDWCHMKMGGIGDRDWFAPQPDRNGRCLTLLNLLCAAEVGMHTLRLARTACDCVLQGTMLEALSNLLVRIENPSNVLVWTYADVAVRR